MIESTNKVKNLLLFILLLLPISLFAQDHVEEAKGRSFKELSIALQNEIEASKRAEGQNDKKTLGRNLSNIGGIYLEIAREPAEQIVADNLISADKRTNLRQSIAYSNRAIEPSESVGDIEQLKTSYKNLNTAQKMMGNVKGAMASYAKLVSLKKTIFNAKKIDNKERKQSEYIHKKTEDSIREQQRIAEERLKEQTQRLSQKQQELQTTHQSLSASEKDKDEARQALTKTQSSLSIEKSNSEEKEKQLTLVEAERALQTAQLSLQQNELQLKQNELHRKDETLAQRKNERLFYIAGIAGLLIISLLTYRNTVIQKRSNTALKKEKKRSEELLLNILPAEVAEELMEKGFADAKHFDNVTVMFTDFVSFTSKAETMSPQQLVGELHICFKAFDGILGKYKIEKIKTVGDAYMAVSGLPAANKDHAGDVIAAAIEIRDFMLKRQVEFGRNTFGIRIGINSGNVVAGIVGVRKFSYDIWGDTVNIAARMEQNSEEGKINISESTYQLVKEKHGCIYRGKVEAKNKGSIDMYYLV
jgi:adenylate cyclase